MVVPVMPFSVAAYGLSDIGLVRQNNEDYWSQIPEVGFFALADGMGGHRAGEVAAHATLDTLCDIIGKTLEKEAPASLEEAKGILELAIEQANQAVYRLGRSDPDLKGMGTTLCCLLFHPKGVIYAHVGDSRIYRNREGVLELLTRDHSLLCELLDLGQLNEKEADDFLYKNIITKAMGTEPSVAPTISLSNIQDGDIWMMCTDGLTDLLTLKEMEQITNESPSIEEGCRLLIETANSRGGHDNVTVVMVKVNDETKDLSR